MVPKNNHAAHLLRILIVKPGAIGDLLHLTPVVRAIKEKHPCAKITLLVGNEISATLFENNSNVDEIFIVDFKGGFWKQFWQFFRAKRRQFDLIVNYQRSNLKIWAFILAMVPARILIYHKSKNRDIHAVEDHLKVVAPLGVEAKRLDLDLLAGKEEEKFADRLFRQHGLAGKDVVALNPGASHPVNRWDVQSFALLADYLQLKAGARVVIVGGAGEDVRLAREIALRSKSEPLILAGETDLLQLAALLGKCRVLVTGDTGPMHIASAVGTPVVALFGPSDPVRTGPIGARHRVVQAEHCECLPCKSRECSKDQSYPDCMKAISAERVFSTVMELLEF